MQLTYETKRFNFLIKIQQKFLKIYSQPLIVKYHIQLDILYILVSGHTQDYHMYYVYALSKIL